MDGNTISYSRRTSRNGNGIAKVAGLLMGLIACCIALVLTNKLYGKIAMRFNLLLLSCTPVIVFHSLNGLETGMAFLTISMMMYGALLTISKSFLGHPYGKELILFNAAWLLGGMARPEYVFYGFMLSMVVYYHLKTGKKRFEWLKSGLYFFMLPGLVYFCWRWQHFGYFMPLPFYYKSGGIISGMGAGYVAISYLFLLGGLVLVALISFFQPSTENRKAILAVLLWPAVISSLTYILFQPFMGFLFRFEAPYFLPLAVAASGAFASFFSCPSGSILRKTASIALIVISFQLLCLNIPAYHYSRVLSPLDLHRNLGLALAKMPEKGLLGCFNDVGAPSFFSNWDSIEAAGLVTPSVSIGKMDAKQLIKVFKPDVIFSNSCETIIEEPDYELVSKQPFIVFQGTNINFYQCISTRKDYKFLDLLKQNTQNLVSIKEPPLYLNLYYALKKHFRII